MMNEENAPAHGWAASVRAAAPRTQAAIVTLLASEGTPPFEGVADVARLALREGGATEWPQRRGHRDVEDTAYEDEVVRVLTAAYAAIVSHRPLDCEALAEGDLATLAAILGDLEAHGLWSSAAEGVGLIDAVLTGGEIHWGAAAP